MGRRLGLLLGASALGAVLLLPPPGEMPPDAWRTAGVGLLMAVWWVTEAIPIPATSLLPLVLFPLLDVAAFDAAARPYAHPLIFLFMGGFLLALAMERWGFPRRISLRILEGMGSRPRRLVAGFMISTALFSMWVSNTATALMMLPIGLSLVELVGEEGSGDGFAVCLMLGIAYGASIGGVGTLIGTPPNAFLAGFLSETHGIEIGFARWMLVGVPLVAVALPLSYWLLTRVLHPVGLEPIPGGTDVVRRELEEMGPPGPAERRVAGVFGLTAGLWMFRPLLDDVVPGLTDAGVAMTAGLLLFLIPPGEAAPGDGEREQAAALLDWESARSLPWGVLILFGGGLSLAAAISSSGLTEWIGGSVQGLAGWPAVALVAAVTVVVILLTELTSNTATTAAFLPLVASVAVGLGRDPVLLAVPAALAASCAFMLPVATPPNAIVYGSGRLTVAQMARAGVWLNLLMAALITVLAVGLLPLVFSAG